MELTNILRTNEQHKGSPRRGSSVVQHCGVLAYSFQVVRSKDPGYQRSHFLTNTQPRHWKLLLVLPKRGGATIVSRIRGGKLKWPGNESSCLLGVACETVQWWCASIDRLLCRPLYICIHRDLSIKRYSNTRFSWACTKSANGYFRSMQPHLVET